jgi:hypothetical protein
LSLSATISKFGVKSTRCQLKFQKTSKTLQIHNNFISSQKNANNVSK